MPETPEPLQITQCTYDNAREASPGRGMPRNFPAASVHPLETNERSLKDFQHLLNLGLQVLAKN